MANSPEPWLRGTRTETPPVLRAVLHALDLAEEDLLNWCGPLTDDELNARPFELAPVSFHMRHIGRSLDRLLTYAEGGELTPEQLQAKALEFSPDASKHAALDELRTALQRARMRVAAFSRPRFDETRAVGALRLPTTLGDLLVHVADHTQRHVGQAITTVRLLLAMREGQHG